MGAIRKKPFGSGEVLKGSRRTAKDLVQRTQATSRTRKLSKLSDRQLTKSKRNASRRKHLADTVRFVRKKGGLTKKFARF